MLMPEFPSCLCLFPGHMIGSVLMKVGVSGGEFVAELVKERLNTHLPSPQKLISGGGDADSQPVTL